MGDSILGIKHQKVIRRGQRCIRVRNQTYSCCLNDILIVLEGFVMIEEPGRYGLPPSLGGKLEGSQVYAVAVFHQLHCL